MANNHWTRWLFKSVDDERRLYASMDAIAFVSHGSRDAFATVFGGLEQKFSVINNLIDIDEIARRADEETPAKSRFTIVNVGRLTRPKRQDRLIEVVAELRRRGHDCEAWIAGTGALEADLHALAQKLNVADSVKFLGFQPNPYPLIKVADVFLLTSDSEGYPLVVAEAMCLGKPVVSTPATGPAEMLADGAGLLTGFDAAGIADAVERVILDRQLAADMGRASLAAARRRFDPAATMARVYALTDGR